MKDDLKRLEAELAALQPQTPSPELQQRISEQLGEQVEPRVNTDERGSEPRQSEFDRGIRGRASGRAHVVRLALAVAALAACVTIALGLLPRDDERRTVAHPPHSPVIPQGAAFDETLPSVWRYRRALARSPEDLELLLDHHTASAAMVEPNYEQVGALARSREELDDLLGGR